MDNQPAGACLLLTTNPHPLGRGYSTLESDMNIELEEVVVLDVSDEALELAAGGAQQGGASFVLGVSFCHLC
jgi:hypothetical protein